MRTTFSQVVLERAWVLLVVIIMALSAISMAAFAQDSKGGGGGDAKGTVEQTALTLKQLALTNLGNGEGIKEVMKAYTYILRSTDERFWIGGNRIDARFGHKVFDFERKAVKHLERACNPSRPTYLGADVCNSIRADVMANLAKADKLLAQTAFTDAAGGSQQQLDKATESMTAAGSEETAGDFEGAIKDYKKSWHHSQLAMKLEDKGGDKKR